MESDCGPQKGSQPLRPALHTRAAGETEAQRGGLARGQGLLPPPAPQPAGRVHHGLALRGGLTALGPLCGPL